MRNAWCALTVLKYTWPVTAIMASGLVVNPPCNLLLIKRGLQRFGDGGGGIACATSTLITEVVIVSLLLRMLGRRGFDARLVSSITKSVLVAALVVLADAFLWRSLPPLVRLIVDGLAYVVMAVVSGAVDVRGVRDFVQSALKQRKASRANT